MDWCKRNYRILKHIYRHPEITEGDIRTKFGDDDTGWLLIQMVQEKYIGGENADGSLLMLDKVPYQTGFDTKYASLAKGDAVVEESRKQAWKWILPTALASASLLWNILNSIFR